MDRLSLLTKKKPAYAYAYGNLFIYEARESSLVPEGFLTEAINSTATAGSILALTAVSAAYATAAAGPLLGK